MSKFFVFGLLALIGAISLLQSAMAQDFNHRDSRGRRTQDHRRGMRDQRDCSMLVSRVADAACYDAKGGPNGADYGACGRIMQFMAQNPEAFVAEIVDGRGWSRNGGSSPGTEGLAREAADCQGNREAAFDRDAERESNEWHEREERRYQEQEEARRRQQQQG